jgi:hypothetical protein
MNASGERTPRTRRTKPALRRITARLRGQPPAARPAQPDQPGRNRRSLRFAGTIAALIAAGAAYVSYTHGLDVARWTGNTGAVAYVIPALPDGLIAISTVSLYEAARSTGKHPATAVGGLILGIGLTVVMNVAAGLRNGIGGALVAAMVPVVLLLALEILTGVVRRGRGGLLPDTAPATHDSPGDSPDRCPHLVALNVEDAVRAAWDHASQCLGEQPTFSGVGASFGIDRRKVSALVGTSEPPRAASTPVAALGDVAGAGSDNRTAPATLNGVSQ